MAVSEDPNVEPDPEDLDPAGETDDDAGADQLGDAGKKALDSMKAKWQKERDANKALKDQIAKHNAGTKDPAEPVDADAIRKTAQAEARAEVLRDRALDKVETAAAKLFADPEDARLQLAAQVDDFIDDGKIDTDAIADAITKLLKKKPHLAAATARRFQGGADGGARNGSTGPKQLTEQDLKSMSPHQIEAARVKGQLTDLMS
jgi:hypothetical protein